MLYGLTLMTERDWGHLFASLIPLMVIVLAIYFVSFYFATRKFEKWIDRLVARYAAHVARGGK
jgi:phosphotransferase system  glucose/maltose/N-acetylglucosamine-specific IIC component